ncbi:MAG: tetratricopeptide repeat protein [Pyrinomonadaceae bacterium]|nr:tetratricopeptide repeat protein [Pyrinomonadaceae bacterium]MCX7640281.1 tetratricopeptide repeat protein [Pyrinomonadaceae bacterium]MDW8305271.1 tetratricopeptide repeat protein [Acidobacteriota bacterium]
MLTARFFDDNKEILAFLFLAALCIAIYGQTVKFDFINTDDNLYVYENQKVLSGLTWDSIYWAFTEFHSANWHPLTWISHQIDVSLFGVNPGAHHATNVIFHLLNSFLALIVFFRFTNDFWKSFFVALIFAVHPTHVESVAWISERKDVLSTMFWLLTMLAYLSYCQTKTRIALKYAIVVLLFALGLMAKPMLVTLPAVLLLCDYWPLGRLRALKDLRWLILEKIPLFLLTVISSYITLLAQASAGAVETLERLPLEVRLMNAAISYVSYIGMFFYPVNLGLQYAYRRVIDFGILGVALVVLAAISAFCIWQWKKRKYLIIGWLWFLGTLVPVIGIVQVGAQAMADRYTYIPYFGLSLMVVWGISELAENLRLKKAAVVLGLIVSLAFTGLAYRQTSYWRDSETLYRHSLSVVGESFLIAHNLCHTLWLKDNLDEAKQYCLKAIAWNKEHDKSYTLLGYIAVKQKKYEEALNYFSVAARFKPDSPEAFLNFSNVLYLLERYEEAEENLRKCISLIKEEDKLRYVGSLTKAYKDLGVAFLTKKEPEKAAKVYERFLGAFPEQAEAIRAEYAFALFLAGRLDDAEKQIQLVLQQRPDYADGYNTYGLILLAKGKFEEAEQKFKKALDINPEFESAKTNLDNVKRMKR